MFTSVLAVPGLPADVFLGPQTSGRTVADALTRDPDARFGNLGELARRVNMSREGLYKALSADGNPSFATIVKVTKALGLKLHFDAIA
ncbi:addiction module antidote protein [Rathayibacter soli]|uniref:addiction module antidote protein n=1 Tax=Rathayibacter soli TaxID=3144168 RepID=UPI0027E5A64B|nr:addiction module antidote protein [Glaciibacter superstes]